MNGQRSNAAELYEARLAEALDELRASPIPAAMHFPWPLRLLRRVGIRVRPPLYTPFAVNALLNGASFALCGAGVAWLGSRWGWSEASPSDLAILGLVVVGPFAAVWTSIAAWRHALSPWRELGAVRAAGGEPAA